MKRTIIVSITALLLAGACGRAGGNLQRDQKQYEVVEEGQAGSVSSTIAAPGEVLPPLMPMTGTNADTTTAFNLPNAGTMTTTDYPGTIAGTLPSQPTYPRYPSSPPPRPRPAAPPPPTTTASEPPPPAEQPAQPADEKKEEQQNREEEEEEEPEEEEEEEKKDEEKKPEQPQPPPPPG
jgi:hypothetical protein